MASVQVYARNIVYMVHSRRLSVLFSHLHTSKKIIFNFNKYYYIFYASLY